VTCITAAAAGRGYKAGMSKSLLRPILADWRRWSRAERIAAVLLLAGIMLIQVPLLLHG
jgi:hypothetical protein